MGSGDEGGGRVPRSRRQTPEPVVWGLPELFAWRKTCILAGVCFPASFLKQSLLPRGREKTSGGDSADSKGSCEQIPSG